VAPEGLRDRLKAKLREVVVTVDTQGVTVETTEVEIREI
jgi:hypothetical protein